ncbi:hypothetical protein EDB85DRAFT_1979859 [Lactarius pseudohatsudake]|nr:hypothetical protein EDB85DRAFT_1979859 [Lactarius pseudohatsudake]
MMLHSSARQAEEEAWICLPSRSHAVAIVIAMAMANFVDRPADLGLLVRRLATPSLRQRLCQPSHRPAPPTLSPRLRLSSPPAIPTSLPPSRPLASPLLALPRPAFACSRVLSSWLVSFCLTPLRGILSASNLHGLGSVHLPSLRLIVAWYSPAGPWYSPALPSFPPISPRYHPQTCGSHLHPSPYARSPSPPPRRAKAQSRCHAIATRKTHHIYLRRDTTQTRRTGPHRRRQRRGNVDTTATTAARIQQQGRHRQRGGRRYRHPCRHRHRHRRPQGRQQQGRQCRHRQR